MEREGIVGRLGKGNTPVYREYDAARCVVVESSSSSGTEPSWS